MRLTYDHTGWLASYRDGECSAEDAADGLVSGAEQDIVMLEELEEYADRLLAESYRDDLGSALRAAVAMALEPACWWCGTLTGDIVDVGRNAAGVMTRACLCCVHEHGIQVPGEVAA